MLREQRLGGWLCLLSFALHLLAPLGHGSPALHRDTQVIVGSGDLAGMNPPAAGSGTTLYAWDTANKLTGVTLPDGRQYGYAYDYRGRRVGEGVRLQLADKTSRTLSPKNAVIETQMIETAKILTWQGGSVWQHRHRVDATATMEAQRVALPPELGCLLALAQPL